MPSQDTTQLKEKILSILRRRGPSLPVHIAGETGLSILFASAFLSELIAERKIKISNLRVGSSPVYFIPGQEPQLEKFSHHLKSKEKDAHLLLKEKKFLDDEKQEPAIRVALRSIKDFAFGFQKDGKIFWRYFTVPESELNKPKPEIKEAVHHEKPHEEKPKHIPESLLTEVRQIVQEKEKPIEKHEEKKPAEDKKKDLDIFDKKETEKPKPVKKTTKKTAAKKTSGKTNQKANEKFFDKVKEFLNEKGIEITGIEGFSKNDLTLKIRSPKEEKEKLLVAYDKKRITEADILNAHKKAKAENLKYIILSLGDLQKKTLAFIGAIQDLEGIEKL